MKRGISLQKSLRVILVILILGIASFSSTEALFKRRPLFQRLQPVDLETIYKAHIEGDSFGTFTVEHPIQEMEDNQDYSVICNNTEYEEASIDWYSFRRRNAENESEVPLELELNTIYTCVGLIRTDEEAGTRLYTHHDEEFQAMVCHEDPIDNSFADLRTKCTKGAKSEALDDRRHVSFLNGSVPQHAAEGWWQTDPSGVVFGGWPYIFNEDGNQKRYEDKLDYCKRFWSATVKIIDPANSNTTRGWHQEININPPEIYQTLTNWYDVNNLRRPSTMRTRTYECEEIWYHWEYDDYGTCQCDGMKYRNIECLSNVLINGFGEIVDDSYCDSNTEPIRMESCAAPSACFDWNETTYGTCKCDGRKYMDHNCRNFGMDAIRNTRPVAGVPLITAPNPTIVSDSVCTGFGKVEPVKSSVCPWSAVSSSCFAWELTGYNTCTCASIKTRIYECKNIPTNTVVADTYCTATKPSGQDSCTQAELPASCFCDASDWNAAAACSTGCYLTNYINYGTKKTASASCIGTVGRPVNNCNNAKACCITTDCSSGEICTASNTCLPQYHRYYCLNKVWGLSAYNASTTALNCTGIKTSGTTAYCTVTPYGTCCSSVYNNACVSGHYTGQTYNCDGVCTGGTACTKPANSAWVSTNGCTWTCDTDYVQSGNSCVLRSCNSTDWNPAVCTYCYTVAYTTYGTKKTGVNCQGTTGRQSLYCGDIEYCCSVLDCDLDERCISGYCIPIGHPGGLGGIE